MSVRQPQHTCVSAPVHEFRQMSNFALPMSLPKFSAAIKDSASEFAPARLAACVSFGLADDSECTEAVTYLTALLGDPVEEIRTQAIESLASLATRGASIERDAVLPLLDDDCVDVRAAVLQHGELLLERPLSVAIAASRAGDEMIRYSAALLLGALDSPQAVDALSEMLDDPSFMIRRAAAIQLGKNGNERSAAVLERIVEQHLDDASMAIVTLADLKLSRSKPVIQRLAQKRFGALELKAMACAALLRFNDPPEAQEFEKMFRSRRRTVRMAALRASATIPHIDMVTVLINHVSNSKLDDEKSAALWALVETSRMYPECLDAVSGLRPTLSSALQIELDEYLKG